VGTLVRSARPAQSSSHRASPPIFVASQDRTTSSCREHHDSRSGSVQGEGRSSGRQEYEEGRILWTPYLGA